MWSSDSLVFKITWPAVPTMCEPRRFADTESVNCLTTRWLGEWPSSRSHHQESKHTKGEMIMTKLCEQCAHCSIGVTSWRQLQNESVL